MLIEQVNQYITIVVLLAGIINLAVVYKRDLMMLQLNSYRNERYTRWFNQSNESTQYFRLILCVALFLILIKKFPLYCTATIAAIIAVGTIVTLARKKYKKPLVMTKRASRIFTTMLGLSAICIGVAGIVSQSWLAPAAVALALAIVSPGVLLLSNWLLRPIEKHINAGFYNEAKSILQSMPELKIIGVTGSYGKTSTKHYLNRILSEKFDVMMTPGSFNTTLGVVRTVREYLKPYNEVFIVEMGAKQPGDVKEICDLVNPSIGIVTAVGEQHLESFKTIENIQKTKFELVDALPADGLAVVNNDFEMSAIRPVSNVECVHYGISNTQGADFTVSDVELDETGTTFTISGRDHKLRLHTKLVGECNISNLMAAVIVALHMGVEDEKIKYAVEKIEQVEHRLNMKRTPGGVTIIDDAFNSNPTGSKMALDVLSGMKGGKRIVVTPGMIELGDRQFDANQKFGEIIAVSADVAIVVGQYNREAIVSGILKGGMSDDNIHCVDTFAQAQSLLSTMLVAGATVLYENDLPDTFK
jgi:UDP-N-acetylmuramoyl-tripeptide--D-alanyl-D-alanine ligase